jgi:hypothetical protein
MVCPNRARAGYRLRGYGNSYRYRSLHPHHRALRGPPFKPTAIGASFTVDLRSLQRRAGDLRRGTDVRRVARSAHCDGMRRPS